MLYNYHTLGSVYYFKSINSLKMQQLLTLIKKNLIAVLDEQFQYDGMLKLYSSSSNRNLGCRTDPEYEWLTVSYEEAGCFDIDLTLSIDSSDDWAIGLFDNAVPFFEKNTSIYLATASELDIEDYTENDYTQLQYNYELLYKIIETNLSNIVTKSIEEYKLK